MADVQKVLGGRMKICAVIPVHNEAKTIGGIVESLSFKHIESLVIDDGSSDGSGQIAKSKGATVITNNPRGGKGNALKQGFAYAIKHHYDAVITIDGDGQHDIGDIENFIQQAHKDPVSVITGNRMSNAKGMPFLRYVTNTFMSFIISSACKHKISDTQCGYRYIHCSILREIALISNDFEIETEILMKTSKKGYPIYSVPVKTIYNNEESKISPFRDSVRFINYFLKELRNKA